MDIVIHVNVDRSEGLNKAREQVEEAVLELLDS